MRRFATYLAAVAAILVVGEARAQDAPPAGRYVIHVITMDPGDELFARFGHIALVVDDREESTRRVYNYGTFDFDDPDLRLKYARGFLTYWLSVAPYGRTVRHYREGGRRAVRRTLSLAPDRAAALARKLEENARPENREYAYRHYLDNCCTRIRDLLDEATDGAIRRGRDARPTGRTFRDWTRRALVGLPVTGTAILFSLGPAVDRPITRFEEQFLPEVLSEDLDEIRIGPDARPLVSAREEVSAGRGPRPGASIPPVEAAVSIAIVALMALGFFAPILLGPRRVAARLAGLGLSVWGLLAGVGGMVLVLFLFTEHTDTHGNENMLVAPVFHLWLLGPGLKLLVRGTLGPRAARVLTWYLTASLGLVALDAALKAGPFVQDNWEFVAFAAAADALALTALARCRLASWRGPRPTDASDQTR